jgi:hypothetical protein
MPGSKAPRFSVDFLTEGEILVRGTLDPHEALKVVFEEAWDEGDIDDRLYEVARPHFPDDPEPTQKAINEFADWLFELLEKPRCRYWRKVNCLSSAWFASEGWAWALHPAEQGKPGAFPGVEFSR